MPDEKIPQAFTYTTADNRIIGVDWGSEDKSVVMECRIHEDGKIEVVSTKEIDEQGVVQQWHLKQNNT